MNSSRTYLFPSLALALLALAAVTLFSTSTSQAKEWDSDEHNLVLTIPTAPAAWRWLPESTTWKSQGIVKGASRYLDKLKTGAKATFEGGMLHVFDLPLPEGQALKDVCADAEIRGRMLKRFEGKPEVEEYGIKLNGELPAKMIIAKGKARNRLGEATRAEGRLLIVVVRGRIVILRMFIWPTEYDDEQLGLDLGWIEGEFFIKNTTAKTAKPVTPVTPDKGGKGGEGDNANPGDAPEGDAGTGKAEDVQFREHLLRMTIHPKLKHKGAELADTQVLFLEAADSHGWYQVVLYATKNGRTVNGQVTPNEDIKKWMTKSWWQAFGQTHPKGPLYTFRWPKKIKARTFITLPDLSDGERKVLAKEGRRPIDPKASLMIKKLRMVEKVKRKELGKGRKVSEALRGIIQGKRPRFGDETVVRFAWRSAFFSFKLIVTVGGEGYKKWGDALRETMESIHHFKD